MTTKLKISALATALTVGLVTLSSGVYATTGGDFNRGSTTSINVQDTNNKAIAKQVIADMKQSEEGKTRLKNEFGLEADWFTDQGDITEEGKNHVLMKDDGTFKSETYLDQQEQAKFAEQKAALANNQDPNSNPNPDSNQNPGDTNKQENSENTQNNNQSGADKNTTPATPTTSTTPALTEAELSLASTAVTGTLATAPVALVGNVQAVAGSFFDAVGSNFSSAPSLLTDAGTVSPAVGSDAGKEFLGTPVSRDDLAPGYHVYFDYGYRNHTLKVSSANSKVKQYNFAVGFYAQDAGLNYGLALVKSNGTNTSTPTKARTWTEKVAEGDGEKKVTKSSNYASRTKSNSTGLMGSVGLASNTDFVNFGAFVLFSNTKNYRSSVGFEDQRSSVDSRQYGFDVTYGHRLYKDNNSSVVVKAGLTDVYYTQDAFAETAATDAAKAEALSFQKMSKNNVFLHLGVQGTYLARVNDYLFQTDAGLKLEQALTNNRFDFKLKDGTVVKGAAGDTFTARLVVGETLYVDNFSLRLGAEFATGNKTNARLDKLTATAAYKF